MSEIAKQRQDILTLSKQVNDAGLTFKMQYEINQNKLRSQSEIISQLEHSKNLLCVEDVFERDNSVGRHGSAFDEEYQEKLLDEIEDMYAIDMHVDGTRIVIKGMDGITFNSDPRIIISECIAQSKTGQELGDTNFVENVIFSSPYATFEMYQVIKEMERHTHLELHEISSMDALQLQQLDDDTIVRIYSGLRAYMEHSSEADLFLRAQQEAISFADNIRGQVREVDFMIDDYNRDIIRKFISYAEKKNARHS